MSREGYARVVDDALLDRSSDHGVALTHRAECNGLIDGRQYVMRITFVGYACTNCFFGGYVDQWQHPGFVGRYFIDAAIGSEPNI